MLNHVNEIYSLDLQFLFLHTTKMATELDLNRDQGHINKRSYEKIHFSGSIQSHSLN